MLSGYYLTLFGLSNAQLPSGMLICVDVPMCLTLIKLGSTQMRC